MKKAIERAEELRLDAALSEVSGVGPADDLLERTLERLDAPTTELASPSPRRLTSYRWMAAGLLLFGVGIVGGVTWLQRGERDGDVVQEQTGGVSFAEAKAAAGLPAHEEVTLIADYPRNRLSVVNEEGQEIAGIDKIYGIWDCELTAGGHLLVTEFSVSRVSEIDMTGRRLWSYEDLRNPYDADRLPNGNTLIADAFNGRVIEVDVASHVVWEFGDDIRPFDVDRLRNGNTLIADVLHDRVIEVSPQGEIVWRLPNMPSVHDADRLPDGNTLITLRTLNRVIEVDADGREVLRISDLQAPSDADRLPNGNTLVAENNLVREFDRFGREVGRVGTTWAVEVNRY